MSISIPFTVYAKIVPERTNNKRRTYTKSMEKIANYIAIELGQYLKSNPGRFNINENQSVSVSPQFGQYNAKVTITGWDYPTSAPDNFQPASEVSVDAPQTDTQDDNYNGTPGKVVSGYEGTQYLDPQGQTLDPNLRSTMLDLKSVLESASVYLDEIYRIDYMGVTFGKGGYSFQ